MAGGISGGESDAPLSEINVTPLVDVMLVLLVIFIVAAPLMSQALRVDLPRAAAPAATEVDVATLEIRGDGTVALDRHSLARRDLGTALAGLASARPDVVLQIAADAGVPYRHVAKALSLARQGGLVRVAFATRPAD